MPSVTPDRLMADRTCAVMSIISSRVAVRTLIVWRSVTRSVCHAWYSSCITFGVVKCARILALGLALGLAIAAVAGCGTTDVTHPVKDVNFKGNHAYSDDDIIDHLATQPPQGWLFKTPLEYDRVGLQLDRRRVEAFYRERGYFSAQVTDVNVQHLDDGGVKVTI